MNKQTSPLSIIPSAARDNRRRAARHKTLMAGEILLHNEAGRHACNIRNLSATGALLKVAGSIAVPSTFTLVICRDGRHIPAKVMWRARDTVGVSFTGPATVR